MWGPTKGKCDQAKQGKRYVTVFADARRFEDPQVTKDVRIDHPVVNNHHAMRAVIIPGAVVGALPLHSVMTKSDTSPSIDEYLHERLMPVEGAIPHINQVRAAFS